MEKENKVSKKTLKRQHLFELAIGLFLVVLINLIGSYVFYRLDLTSEKRYTLSETTKKMLKNDVKDIVYFKVYLDGDFPAGFKKLSKETREMLDEFRAYNENIEYEFINPSSSEDKITRNSVYEQLMKKGLEPTSLQVKEKGGSSQQIIFPGAIVTYRQKEIPLQLLQTKTGASPEEQLNNSIQSLEYELSNAIRKLSIPMKKKVGFLYGHGELDEYETGDITAALKEYYAVERVKINEKISSLIEYDALIIASPDSMFSDKDKYVIDQFIMKGGKVLWFIDQVYADLDSLRATRNDMMGLQKRLDLDFMLFRYGAKIKTDLVQDLQSLPIPVQVGNMGGKPQYDFYPWFYFPLVSPASDHPIVKNLDLVKTNFPNCIDTNVVANGIKKTVLLRTSKFSKVIPTPAYITLDILRQKPNEGMYIDSYQPIAMLLEGSFNSAFKNRLAPEFMEKKDSIGYIENCVKSNKMIVVADGDIIKNQIRISNGKTMPLPLGYDMYSYNYTKSLFGNKNFVINAVNFLLDDSNLISVRARDLKLRLLDGQKVEKNRFIYQFINVVAPVLLVILLGFIFSVLKRRKYTK
ncbi:MAG: gliding motility-associated ABC transporter substrate-binding protein GldG [Bacteroidota bacterium]